jgi:hypothetical protein
MKVRKTLLVGAAGWAALAAHASVNAQVGTIPAAPAVPGVAAAAPAAPLGIAPGPAQPGPTTFWQKLGLGKEQKEFCKRKLCATPLGQLINNSKAPLTALSGGLIPPFCPLTPTLADLADPGAVGAAAAIQADEAGAKKRRAAVRYLGTVDCHYWPEAEDALVASLRGDRNECVRWEAAMALGSGCCCTKKTIEALTIVVSCSDRDGAPKETSYRVHAAAAAALDHCLACFCNVAADATVTPPPPPPVEGTRPPIEVTPPVKTPVTPPVTETSAAKPISPGDAKPAPGLNPLAAKDPPKRPVGPEYYARVAKAPLAAVLAEARRVAETYHSKPIVAETPFAGQGHTVAAVMNYAVGPDTQTVLPAGMTIPADQVRAEVVAARPANLWDLLTKPNGEGEIVTQQTEIVMAPAPKPVVKQDPVVKREPKTVKKDPVVTRAEPTYKPLVPPAGQVVSTPAPATKPTMTMPAPAPMMPPPPVIVSMSEPAPDFPPPPMPMPMGDPKPTSAPSPYFATKGTGAPVGMSSEPVLPGVSSYHPMAATPVATTKKPAEATGSGLSSYHPTAQTATKADPMSFEPTAPGLSSYHPTAQTAAKPMTMSAEPMAPDLSSYHPTSATPAKATGMPTEGMAPGVSSYNPTGATVARSTATPPEAMAPNVSSYHATAATPATPITVSKPTPTSSPYNSTSAVPARPPMPAPAVKAPTAPMSMPALPAAPMSTRPMPAPPAPVVPASMPKSAPGDEMIAHLLAKAKGAGPVEVRKASIQELVKLKANTPEVMAALDTLGDDPVPGVRAEAVIASARLKLGR